MVDERELVGKLRPVVDPLDGQLDLHTFQPSETADLVREYVHACREKNVLLLRIVHGKGKGMQRRIVHAVLADMPDAVLRYRLAEPARGGWGATSVELRPLSPHGLDEQRLKA